MGATVPSSAMVMIAQHKDVIAVTSQIALVITQQDSWFTSTNGGRNYKLCLGCLELQPEQFKSVSQALSKTDGLKGHIQFQNNDPVEQTIKLKLFPELIHDPLDVRETCSKCIRDILASDRLMKASRLLPEFMPV